MQLAGQPKGGIFVIRHPAELVLFFITNQGDGLGKLQNFLFVNKEISGEKGSLQILKRFPLFENEKRFPLFDDV